MPLLLGLLALSLLANVLLGPLGPGWIVWRVSPLGLNQTLGIDATAMVAAAPLASIAAWLWWRGDRLAAPMALGPALFAVAPPSASAEAWVPSSSWAVCC